MQKTKKPRARWLALAIAFLPITAPAASPVDEAIGRAVRESYNFKALLDSEVLVSVNDGIVLLTGSTHDRDLRSLAADTVSGCAGVLAVNNRIVISTATPEYSDSWVALKLRNDLRMRAGIDAARIQVRVVNQVATLTGGVESSERKALAGKYAEAVRWVRSVRNELVIDAAPKVGSPRNEPMDDASVSALLTYSLRSERLVTLSRTQVSTKSGVVFITGHAESEAEKTLISACALSIRGVISVRNEMVTKSIAP